MSRIYGASQSLNPGIVGLAADGVTLCMEYAEPVFDVTAVGGSTYQFSPYRYGYPRAWLDGVPASVGEVRRLMASGRMYGSFKVDSRGADALVRLDHVELTSAEVNRIGAGEDYRAILFGVPGPFEVVLHGD